jgi:integrase
MIPVVLGTGARKSEQLILKVRQCDFFRNLIIFDRTKSNRPRMVEMTSEVRDILLLLCKGKRPDDYVWPSPKTGLTNTVTGEDLGTLMVADNS